MEGDAPKILRVSFLVLLIFFLFNAVALLPQSVQAQMVTATIPVGNRPYDVAVAPNSAYVYIANDISHTISVVSTATNTVTATITVGTSPSFVAVSPDGAFAYVTTTGGLEVVNTATNTVTATITLGTTPIGVAVSPDGAFAYVTTTGGLEVVNTATNTVTATITLGTSPWGIAVSPDGAFAYVANIVSNTVSVVSTATNTVTATITGLNYPYRLAVSPDGAYVYVTNTASNTVSVVSTATNTVTATITGLNYPEGVAVSPSGVYVFVINAFDNSVSVVNAVSNTVITTITVGSTPDSLAVSPDGAYVYVTNTASNTVSVIKLTQTPTSTPTPTTTTPLVRKLNLSASILIIPSNPLTPQFLATISIIAGTIGIISIASIVITLLQGMSPSQIERLKLPKPLQSVLKKFAEKRIEYIFRKEKLFSKKRSLITKREFLALSTNIIAMSFVIGFVTANGLPNVLSPLFFLRFFAGSLLSVFITQTISFFLDIYFSNRSKVQKELSLWGIGSVLFFVTGLLLKFPFSSPARTDTFGSYRHKQFQQKRVNALIAITKALVLSLPIIPFAVLTLSPISDLVVVGSAGMLITLTSVCFALAPFSPSPGKDIFDYRKPLASILSIPVILIILHYLGWLTFWGYLLIGIIAAFLIPILVNRIEREKRFTRQMDGNLWFK